MAECCRSAPGTVRVADAKGAPPTIPFWLGEAPARSDELSRAVSDLRADIEVRLKPDRHDELASRHDAIRRRRSRAATVASPASLR